MGSHHCLTLTVLFSLALLGCDDGQDSVCEPGETQSMDATVYFNRVGWCD